MPRFERHRATALRVRDVAAQVQERLAYRGNANGWSPWLLGVLAIAIPSHALALWRVVGDLPPGTRPPTRDSVIFQYIGWYLTQGGRLYIDVWELKPPLPYEITAFIAWLAGGDAMVAHGLNILLTVVVAIGGALVAGALVKDLTGDGAAAFTAAMALYLVPAYHWRAAFGFKVKYFVVLFGLLAIYLARRDRPAVAGVAAGAAAGFWQLAVIVPALTLGIAASRQGRPGVRWSAAGIVGMLVVAVLPVVYWGAIEAMLTETLLVPLLIGPGLSDGSPVELLYRLLGVALPVLGMGVAGILRAGWQRPRATWWLPVATTWFGLQVLVVDLDSAPDLFPLLAFLAVGVGLLVGLETGRHRPIALLMAVLVLTSVATMGGFGVGSGPLRNSGGLVYTPDRELAAPYDPVERDLLFWRGVEPETCRVFFGPTQYQLVQRTSLGPLQQQCGDAEPVLKALARAWFS